MQFAKCKMIMLPVEISPIYKEEDGKLYNDYVLESYGGVDHFHLYVLSLDELKVKDYYYTLEFGIEQVQEGKEKLVNLLVNTWTENNYKKIIASTDKTLGLPNIPDEILSEYFKTFNQNSNV